MRRFVNLLLMILNGALVGLGWDAPKWFFGIVIAIFINSLLMVISDFVSELINEFVIKSDIVKRR